MGLHEVAIGGVFISPLFLFALLSIPVTKGILIIIHKTSIFRWVWHEMLFIGALYVIIFTTITLFVGIVF